MYYSLGFRIWHWLHAMVVLGLLATVFLRKTFLSYKQNSAIIMQKVEEFGFTLTQDQAVMIAKTIRAEMWQWHIYLGYALGALLLYRIALALSDAKPKVVWSELSLHKKGVQATYCLLYGVLGFMTLSGFGIYFYEALGFTKDFAHTLKEIHEVAFNFVLFFAVVHVGGVVVAESREEEGIISRMIHGKETK